MRRVSSRFPWLLFDRFHLLLLRVDGNVLVLNIQPQPVVNADVLIGDPNQGEKRNHITSPVCEYQLETCNRQQQRGHVVAQAIFAREEIEELALEPTAALASNLAKFLKFAQYCFVGECPCNAGHRYGQNKQGYNLLVEGHAIRCRKPLVVCSTS
jgi:hypothetical protein